MLLRAAIGSRLILSILRLYFFSNHVDHRRQNKIKYVLKIVLLNLDLLSSRGGLVVEHVD